MEKREKPIKYKNYGNKKDSVYEINNGNNNMVDASISNYKNPTTILVGMWEANKGKFHPTQKPISLMEYLIKTYTSDGELVLDNVMGSGSTGVASKNLGRRFIGIEKEQKYFDIAKERIETIK